MTADCNVVTTVIPWASPREMLISNASCLAQSVPQKERLQLTLVPLPRAASDSEAVTQYLMNALGASVVGVRTWGGVLSMDTSELVDGTEVFHPYAAFRLVRSAARGAAADVEIENRGVLPTLEVSMPPGARGDPQVPLRALSSAATPLPSSRCRSFDCFHPDAHFEFSAAQPSAFPRNARLILHAIRVPLADHLHSTLTYPPALHAIP